MTEGQPEEYAEENSDELVGGMRNALDRGEEINKAKQSFFNAGYTKKEIDEATAALGLSDQVVLEKIPEKKLENQKMQSPIETKKETKKLPTSILPPNRIIFPSKKETKKLPLAKSHEPTKINKALVIVLILLGILFIVTAGFLGIFWDQLFGPF